MESLRLILLSVLVATAHSLPSQINSQQQQVSPLVSQQVPINHQPSAHIPESQGAPLDNAEPSVTNHYPYQSTALSPSSGYHQPYSSSNYGNRDVYNSQQQGGWSSGGGWYPYFGVNAGTAWELSAYFGPIFWGVVAFLVSLLLCVGVSRFVLGADMFGGMFQRIKDSAPSGKALDLDNITNMVYQALDTYGKYAAKEARHGSTDTVKG